MDEKAMKQLEHEILVVDISADGPTAEAERAINEKLAQIDQKLEFYTSAASTFDYALATGVGVLAGAMETLVQKVVQTDLTKTLPTMTNDGPTGADLLRRVLPPGVNVESLPTKEIIGQAHQVLREQAIGQSPVGPVASVALVMLNAASSQKRGSKVPALLELRTSDLMRLLPYATVAGLMNWMQEGAHSDSQSAEKGWFPETLSTLTDVFSEYPVARKVVGSARTWFNDIVKQVVKKDGKLVYPSMGEAFYAFFQHLSKDVPELRKLDLALVLTAVNADKMPLLNEASGLLTKLGAAPLEKQAMPVLLMEVLVRTCYFIKGLAHVLRSGQLHDSSALQAIVPFGNRTVERMITVASMSLVITNTADAATCAAFESAGNAAMYSRQFVARYNYVAAGRCAVAIVREITAEQEEMELLRERRKLTEEQAKLVKVRIEAYKAALAERLDAYLTHDLEAFLAGFEQMDEGLIKGDTNLVIAGNATIQRALGYDPQFETQDEFDALMDSDEDFIL